MMKAVFELFILGGLILMAVGAGWIYPPAGLLVVGIGLWYLALWWRPKTG